MVCAGDLFFFLNREMVSGKTQDLTAFGLRVGEWVICSIKVKDKQLKVYRDEQLIFEHTMDFDLGKIGGVQWSAEGLPEIRKLQMKDKKILLDLLEP